MDVTNLAQDSRIDQRRERIGLWSLGSALLLVTCHIALGFLQRSPYIVYFGGPLGPEHFEALVYSLATLAMIIGFSCLVPPLFNHLQPSWLRTTMKYVIAAVLILASVLGLLIMGLILLLSTGHHYYSFDSPLSADRVVVRESSFLLLGAGAIYQHRSGPVYERVYGYVVDDGATPIGDGQYSIDWTEASVTLHLTVEDYIQDVTAELDR